MNGAALIQVMRERLRDIDLGVGREQQGEFWDDSQMLNILNLAQLNVVNMALFNRESSLLVSLLRQVVLGTRGSLPFNYMHYASATVGPPDKQRSARVYLGGNFIPLETTSIDACYIHEDFVEFYSYDETESYVGNLYYYKEPENIVIGDFENEFPDEIYYDYIVPAAMLFLGMKEPQTQREYKRATRIKELVIPREMQNYLVNKDTTGYDRS